MRMIKCIDSMFFFYQEMEKFVHLSRRSWSNKDGQTPQMLFTAEHGKLKADGEKWMKDTATASSITAALIATVMFAAVFTIPSGIDSVTGNPVLINQYAVELFTVSVGISLFTTVTSLLMFLSILTARYAEEDFLYILPNRLILGLLSLFVSITFMLVAFSATFYLVLEGDFAWLVALLALACLPMTSFVLLQFPLLVDVVRSTYGPGIFGKKGDSIVY